MIAQATMSGAEFDALPYDEGRQWELLEGELIDMPSPTFRHQKIVAKLLVSLTNYLELQTLGDVVPDVEFALTNRTRLHPDLAIFVGEDWRGIDFDKLPIAIPPAIAIEVISPSERTADSMRKIGAYLKRGVLEVWHIFPLDSAATVYTSDSPMAIFADQDRLSSLLLPGWSVELSGLLKIS